MFPRYTNTFFTFLLIILFSSLPALAQKKISGTVTDAQTGESLPSTNILIEGTYRGTITNAEGHYTLSIPDSLIPATLVVRYIGYRSQQRIIRVNTAGRQDFALQPAVTEMREIVVTGEDPGMRIMREVIRRKQQWRQKLHTYRADAYTRQTLSNDTSIVSVSESVSEVFWDQQQGHREVLKSKRQTANIEAADNFAGVSYLPNFYDDNIEIAGFNLVGVTHPEALDYYHFELVGQTSLDDRNVFEIRVKPARKLQPLFRGTVHVLDEEYALLEVDLRPNEVVRFPRPVKSFTTSYEQQFNNFGKEFWLPVDIRIAGDIKVSMVGLDFPMITFRQISRITNYKVNTELPDSLYRQEDLFSVDSTSIGSDSLIARQVDTVPLSLEEKEAYATVDSASSLEDAFKASGFLSRFVNDNDEDGGSDAFGLLSRVPGTLAPSLRYNRVDELFIGLRYEITATDWLDLRGRGGYSTGYEQWNYSGGLSLQWLDNDRFTATTGIDYTADTRSRYGSHIYGPYYTFIPNLLGNPGYFDYYRSEGVRLFTGIENERHDLSLQAGFSSEEHTSLTTNTAYDLVGEKFNYRPNPAIEAGTMNSIGILAGYNLEEGYNFGVTGQKSIRLKIEHSSDALGSDFNFTRYTGRLSWSFPTFYQRRLLSNTLDISIEAGTYSGDPPLQKHGIVDVALGHTSPYGTLRAARNRPYEGPQYLSLVMEHNFRTIPFEAIGLRPLVEGDIGLILFGGAAKTWPVRNSHIAKLNRFQPQGTHGIHWEAGASFNGILGLFRLDFAARLDKPAFLINVGVARLF